MKRIFIDKKDGKIFGFKDYGKKNAKFQQMEVIDGKFKPMLNVEVYDKRRDFIKDDFSEILPNKIHLDGGAIAQLWVNNPNSEFMYLIGENEEVAYDKKLFKRAISTEYIINEDTALWSINDFVKCFRIVSNKCAIVLNSTTIKELESLTLPKEEAKTASFKDILPIGVNIAEEIELEASEFHIQAVDGIITHGMDYHTVNKITLAEDKGVCWEGQDINPALLYFVSDTNASKYVSLHEHKFNIIDVVAVLRTYSLHVDDNVVFRLLNDESKIDNILADAYIYIDENITNNEFFKQIYNKNNGKENKNTSK